MCDPEIPLLTSSEDDLGPVWTSEDEESEESQSKLVIISKKCAPTSGPEGVVVRTVQFRITKYREADG